MPSKGVLSQPRVDRVLGLCLVMGGIVVAVWLASTADASVHNQSAADGEAIFKQKCVSCHTIGGGKLSGPDLQGVTTRRDRDWLVRFIMAPEKLIAAKDPTALQLLAQFNNITMPNMGLSEADAQAVVAYLESASGGGGSPAPTASLPQGDPVQGKALFTGSAVLEKGGVPCISCHTVAGVGLLGGGALGPDLTGASAKYGDPGLASVLASLPFPTMRPIYGNRALTAPEQAHLTAYLQSAGGRQAVDALGWLVLSGAMGLTLTIALFGLVWRKRLRAVRASLLSAARSNRRGTR